MGLDIRIPLGLIFAIIGGVLAIEGLWTRGSAIYQRSMGVNLNLGCGAVMFVFGVAMWFVGRRQKWQDDPVTPRPWERENSSRRGH